MTLIAAPARISTISSTFEVEFEARLHWSADTDAAIEQRVADILVDVQKRGDAAVLGYTARFDGLDVASMNALELTQAELKAAFEAIPAAQRDALQAAAQRVRTYHEAQKKANGQSWSYRDEYGTLLGQKVTPLDRVGIYVPGGKAAYPSSVLMNAIPAHVAGVAEIIMVVPTPKGEKNALVLAAAYVAGVTRAFTIGGAQAVAALALNLDAMGFFPRTFAVFGAMADKDIPGLLAKIAPLVDEWHCTALPNPRAASTLQLTEMVRAACIGLPGGRRQIHSHDNPADALRAAAAAADPADRIVVFGSFYTVGGVLKDGLPRLSAPHVSPPLPPNAPPHVSPPSDSSVGSPLGLYPGSHSSASGSGR